jgi:hypothetical protein
LFWETNVTPDVMLEPGVDEEPAVSLVKRRTKEKK